MPRKRQRPPQESIDSILATLSQHPDLDAEVLQRSIARLRDEWEEQARTKVLHLLRGSDPATQKVAVLVLKEVASEADLELLEDIITDPTVRDSAKMALSPVLKDLGSEIVDEVLVEYLNDPESAWQQIQFRLLELVDRKEIGIEAILRDVVTLPVERRLAFVGWLGSSNDARAALVLIPLLQDQPFSVTYAVVEALEQLGPIAAEHSLPALKYIVSNSMQPNLKQRARTALINLAMQSAPGRPKTFVSEVALQQLQPFEARSSYVHEDGGQLILLVWKRSDGALKGVNILFDDLRGIKDCYSIDELKTEDRPDLDYYLREQGFASFELPFEMASALVLQAATVNKRGQRTLPINFAVWRPLIEVSASSQDKEQLDRLLEPLPLTPETLELAQRGNELFLLPDFSPWLYEPLEQLEPFIERYLQGLHDSTPETVEQFNAEHTQRLNAVLQPLVDEALSELLSERWQVLATARMRMQALLLHLAGREEHSALARAVATVMDPASGIPVQKQSYLRFLMRLSIERGPIRMYFSSANRTKASSLFLTSSEI